MKDTGFMGHLLTFMRADRGMKLKVLSPCMLSSYLILYLMAWHFSIIGIATYAYAGAVAGDLLVLLFGYGVFSLLVTAGIMGLFRFFRGRKYRHRTITFPLGVLFFVFSALRAMDWAALYFAGQHIDNEFWFHAFYSDGTTFVATPTSALLIGTLLLFTIGFVLILKRLWFRMDAVDEYPVAEGELSRNTPRFSRILVPNVTVYILIVALLSAGVMIMPSGDDAKARSQMFAELPEKKAIGSFIDYAFASEPPKTAVLSDDTVEKLSRCGVRVFSGSEGYPLIKKSIYLDARKKNPLKPVVKPGTNIIIIFAESLSQFYLQEEIHGIRGLTPNLHRFIKESCYFTNMYNAAFPTLRGMIATLGSSLYLVEKIRGVQKLKDEDKMKGFRPPIPCRFLFISDVLKKHGYTSVHVQGGSGTFVGMKSAFINRQNYERFYAWESLELQTFAKGKRKSDWGIRDEDVFLFAISMLKENRLKKPFLLTISTLDMHPPFDPLHSHPNARGNKELNTLYGTDKAFGLFRDYLRASPYNDNTMIVVVADHARGPGMQYMELFGSKRGFRQTSYDFIPCVMFLPGNGKWKGTINTTVCTNLDIVPTILDMMNIDVENPFIGLSIWSERPDYPLAVSSYYTVNDEYIMGRISAKDRAAVAQIRWTEDNQKEFFTFMRNLAVKRMIYPEGK